MSLELATGLIESVIEKAAKAACIADGDYKGSDGLIYCHKCNTPKQTRLEIPWSGETRTTFCMCECELAQEKRWEEKAEQTLRKNALLRLKTRGIQDKAVWGWTFANDDQTRPQDMDKARRYYKNWEALYADNTGLLLWGNVGAGKTYFAACIANALLDDGVSVLMTNFSKIINDLSGFKNDKNEYIAEFNKYKLLIIDDLGAERQSEFAQEIVYGVIDERYKSNQPLIVTTNMSLDEIKKPKDVNNARIYDRLLGMCVPIQFFGDSRRREEYQAKIDRAKAILGGG